MGILELKSIELVKLGDDNDETAVSDELGGGVE